MRTSLRVFSAALSTLLLAALIAVAPFAPRAAALNGVHSISISSVNCPEQTASCTVTATVSPSNNVPFDDISARISTVDGTARAGADYTAVNNVLVEFPTGTESDTFQVPITNDAFREPNETFTFTMSQINGASQGSIGTATIVDNEVGNIPTLTIGSGGNSPEQHVDNPRAVTVTLTHYAGQPVTVNYATRDGSATSDSSKGAVDYTGYTTKTLTFNGNGGQDIDPITIKGDALAEPDESFFVDFGSPNNAQIAGTNPAVIGLINDDGQPSDVPKLTVEPIPDKTEGDTSTTNQTVTVTLSPAANQTVTVSYATSNGTAVASTPDAQGDYTTTTGSLTFTQGQTSKSFNVPIVGDPVHEQDETYRVTLSNATNAQIATAERDAKILNDDFGQITTGPGTGGGPHLRLFGATGSDLGGFMAYEPALTAGIHVARGDFFTPTQNGFVAGPDGIDEIVTAPSNFPRNSSLKSRPVVRIFSTSGAQLASFFAFDSGFPGGVYLGAGNLDGEPSNGDELVVAAGPGGGPHVKVLRIKGPGDNIGVLNSFFAYVPGFTGGVRVGVGNVSGDSKDELVTAPGAGGGPHVRVWRPDAGGGATELAGFFAYEGGFAGGVFVAASNGRIATGPGAGGGPHVRLFDGNGSPQGGGFFAYEPGFTGGISVAMGNLDNTNASEVITGPGPGGGPHIRIFAQDGSLPFGNGFFAYEPGFTGGVDVGVSTTA